MPSVSMGFCVAMTKKGEGTRCVWPAMVTCLSCMTSNKALCTLAGARLISSANSKLANTGPRIVVIYLLESTWLKIAFTVILGFIMIGLHSQNNSEKEKYLEMLRLKATGLNYETIAKNMGYANKSSISKIINKGQRMGWSS